MNRTAPVASRGRGGLRTPFSDDRPSERRPGGGVRPADRYHAAPPAVARTQPSPAVRSESDTDVSFEDAPFDIPVADRVRRLPPYLFGKINKLKLERRRAGADVIDLGMGNPTDPPDAQISEKLKEALLDPKNHRYSVSNGIENLRREVAKRYDRKYGVKLNADSEVLACLGSKEGFSHSCLALMGPSDTAIVPAPTFPIHSYAVMLAGGNVIQLDVRDPAAYLDRIAYTCEHLFPKPKVVVANFPHNPTGTTVEQDFFDELVRLAKRFGFLVLSDFAYADIGFDGYQPPSFLASEGAKDVGVEFTTMSKGYSMAGWRIGFCAGNRADGAGPRNHQGLLRLRDLSSRADRRDYCHAARRPSRRRGGGGVRQTPGRARRRAEPHRLERAEAESRDVCLGADPGAVP